MTDRMQVDSNNKQQILDQFRVFQAEAHNIVLAIEKAAALKKEDDVTGTAELQSFRKVVHEFRRGLDIDIRILMRMETLEQEDIQFWKEILQQNSELIQEIHRLTKQLALPQDPSSTIMCISSLERKLEDEGQAGISNKIRNLSLLRNTAEVRHVLKGRRKLEDVLWEFQNQFDNLTILSDMLHSVIQSRCCSDSARFLETVDYIDVVRDDLHKWIRLLRTKPLPIDELKQRADRKKGRQLQQLGITQDGTSVLP